MQYLREYLDRDTSVLIFQFLDNFRPFTLKEIKDSSIGISDWYYVAEDVCCDANRDVKESIEILKYCLSKGVIFGNFCFAYSATLGIIKYLESLIPKLTPQTYAMCMTNAIVIKNMKIIEYCQKHIGHVKHIMEDGMSISAAYGNFKYLKYFENRIHQPISDHVVRECITRAAGGNQIDMIKHLDAIYKRSLSRIWFDCMVQCLMYDALDTLKYCESKIIDGNVKQREQHKCGGKVTYGFWFVLFMSANASVGTKTYKYCDSKLSDKQCDPCEKMKVSYY